MECPECKSHHVHRNGNKRGKQNYICVDCQRQFLDCYQLQKGYGDELKRECLKMDKDGMGFRAIARVKNVSHVTVMNWVKQVGELLPNAYESEAIPQVGELDELEMRNALARKHLNSIQVNGRAFVGSKKTNSGKGDCCRSFSTRYLRLGAGRS